MMADLLAWALLLGLFGIGDIQLIHSILALVREISPLTSVFVCQVQFCFPPVVATVSSKPEPTVVAPAVVPPLLGSLSLSWWSATDCTIGAAGFA